MRFETEEQVIAAANDTPFGLAAYFYTTDVRRIARITAAARGTAGLGADPDKVS